MVLMLGVATAMKAMHHYRVRSGSGSTRRAKAVRNEGEAADTELAMEMGKQKQRASRHGDEDSENEPLMDDEVTRSQEGVDEGAVRPYAHRDIKPGEFLLSLIFQQEAHVI